MNQSLPEHTTFNILVVDDHELMLAGTIEPLKQQYPEAKIITSQTAEDTLNQVDIHHPELVILDLAIPEKPGMTAETNTGIQVLKTLLKKKLNINFVVLSSNAKKLVRIKYEILNYEGGGFTLADKSSIKDFLTKTDWALQGVFHTRDVPEMRTEELRPEWLEVLELGSQGLQDKKIAESMHIADRTVWNYWHKIRDVFGVFPKDGDDRRVLTLRKAREMGFID